ncbi:MAG: TolC family protein [Bacteroidetes bacterium]|nr:TolC family protein [Bacteroidota bacterium]MBS1648961.1 TolC family protein [Bacteroidota bacterium]
MKKYFAIIFTFISIAGNTQTRLTLDEAINIALKNNYDIQISKSNVDINKINNNYGVAGGLPIVTGTVSNQESVVNINQKVNSSVGVLNIDRNGASSNSLNTNVSGSILLYNGLSVVANKKRLEKLEQQSQQQLISQIQTTIASVSTKYFDVVRQTFYLKSLQYSINLSKKQLELVEIKKNVGMANNADLFQSQIDLNARLQDYKAQELIVSQTKADLLTLLTIKPDSSIIITDTIIVEKDIILENILNNINANADLISADNQIQINELIEKQVAAQRYPALRFSTGVSFGRTVNGGGQILLNQSYGPFAGLSVGIPIYNGGVYKKQQQVAQVNTKIAQTQKQSLLLSLQNNAVKTYQAYTNNLSQLAMQQNTYNISLQLVQLTQQRYQLAQATILELREAQKSYEDAAYRLINLSFAAKAATIELKRLENKLGL